MDVSVFNPFKNAYNINNADISLNKTFNQLSRKHKAITIIATTIVAIFTLGTCAYFYARLLTGRLKKLEEIEDDKTTLKIDRVTNQILKPTEDCSNTSEIVPQVLQDELNFPEQPVIANVTNINNTDEQKSKKEIDRDIFLKYQKEQEKSQLPVDLVLCRGKVVTSDYPHLLSTRYSSDKKEQIAYNPLHVDLDKGAQPDIQANISSQDMECFPDSSIDDIFMERVFPSSVQLDIFTYFHITRILKVNGTFIMDKSSLCDSSQMEKVGLMLQDIFIKCNIPLMLTKTDVRRNNERPDLRIAFIKTDEFNSLDQKYIRKKGRAINAYMMRALGGFIHTTDGTSRLKNPKLSIDQLGHEALNLFEERLSLLLNRSSWFENK